MRALSIRQPWAWLIVHGPKDVENRTWSTDYRGPLLIHAGKTFERDAWEWLRREYPEIYLPPISAFHRGGIVGRCEIMDVVDASPSRWFTGPVGFVLHHREPLPFTPYRGQLGLFDVPESVLTSRDEPG